MVFTVFITGTRRQVGDGDEGDKRDKVTTEIVGVDEES